jgi:hypothetical protein
MKVRIGQIVAGWVLILLAATSNSDPVHGQPSLGVHGTRFTVAGTPRFIVLASYFDALDAAHLGEDLEWLRTRVDGVRLFVNWWDFDERRRCATRFSERTVMRVDSDGRVSIARDRLDRLRTVLQAIRQAGLVADVTFSYETVAGLSRLAGDDRGVVCGSSSSLVNRVRLDAYLPAVGEIARALAGRDYDHVLLDLQNESNGGWGRLTSADLVALAREVRQAAPERLITASSFDPRPDRQVPLVERAKLDVLTFHDWPRDKRWPERTGSEINAFRSTLDRAGLQVPILAGEPPWHSYGRGAEAFRTALETARRAGAAGWTLHTHAGFRLDDARFVDGLDPAAREFLDRLAASRARTGAAPVGGRAVAP